MRRVFILLILIVLLGVISTVTNCANRPLLVFTSVIYIDESYGMLYPEVAVDKNGKWREATYYDIWEGQSFVTFDNTDIGEVIVKNDPKSAEDLPVEIDIIDNSKIEGYCFGFYKGGSFVNRGEGNLIKGKEVHKTITENLFDSDIMISEMLQNVVSIDINNINDDFSLKLAPTVVDYLVGDINGDKQNDYVLVIGEKTIGSFDSDSSAIIIYLSGERKYQRIPVYCWERTNETWPELLFIKDVNDNGISEIFLAEADSDTSTLMVYEWNGNGLIKLFRANREMWH